MSSEDRDGNKRLRRAAFEAAGHRGLHGGHISNVLEALQAHNIVSDTLSTPQIRNDLAKHHKAWTNKWTHTVEVPLVSGDAFKWVVSSHILCCNFCMRVCLIFRISWI